MPADEKTDRRDGPEPDVEAHRYVADEPGEEDPDKMKTKMKMKTKTQSSDELGDDFENKTKY